MQIYVNAIYKGIDNRKNWWTFPVTGYRQIGSFSSFFHSGKSRQFAPTMNIRNYQVLYYQLDEHELEFRKNNYPDVMKPLLDVESAIKLNSIFEFYEVIGYDYKKQKYNKEKYATLDL